MATKIDDATLMGAWRLAKHVSRPLVDDDAEAEDCASDAVVALLTTTAPVRDVNAFVLRAARRRAADLVRRRSYDRGRVARITGQASPVDAGDVQRCLDQAEAEWLVGRVWPRLPEQSKVVVEHRARDLSVSEVASELAVTVRSVDGHLRRARELANKILAPTLGGLGLWTWVRRSVPAPTALASATLACALAATWAAPAVNAPEPGLTSPELSHVEVTPVPPTASGVRDPGPTGRRTISHRPLPAPPEQRQPTERDLVISPPTGPIAPLTFGDTGGSEAGPLEVVEACLRDMQVSLQQIGCSG